MKEPKISRIPGDPGTKTPVYQPNHVTTAALDYSLIQGKIFDYTMFYLQMFISEVMKGKQVQQLDIFKDPTDIQIAIPMKHIATAPQYKFVKDAAKAMVGTIITMKLPGLHGKQKIRFAGLFSAIEMDISKPTVILAWVRRDVAEHLVNVGHNGSKPCNYTSFILEVALRSTNKYTPRIYKLISSWKHKGGFEIRLDELKEMLCLVDKYQDYNLFKRRVLIPAQDELKENADCWFNMSEVVEIKEGKKVVALRFKVIEVDLEKRRELLLHNLYNVLRAVFGLKDKHFDILSPILTTRLDFSAVDQKVDDLHYRLKGNAAIEDKQMYVVKSFLNAFQ